MTEEITLLLTGIGQLITLAEGPVPRTGAAMGEIGRIEGGAVAVAGSRIVDAGPERDVRARHPDAGAARWIDCRGRVVTPGLVDAHTHPVFTGFRLDEYEMRTRGATYQEIAERGGGIVSSLAGVRAASEADLRGVALERLDAFLLHGTTTIEAKSGYGLTLEDERKSLRVIGWLDSHHPVHLVPTFLGAHAVPPEYTGRTGEYVDRIVREMIPAVAREGLARFCDVFMEAGYFDGEETRTILEAARAAGLGARIHADELSACGGAELAAEIGVVSADHLVCASDAGIEAMARRGVIAILLPGTTFFLGSDRYAPARKMIDRGVPVALATDFNPGSSTTRNLQQVMSIAVARMGIGPAEALTAATVNAACALRMADDIGTIAPGRRADLAIFDVKDYREIAYLFGTNHCGTVIKRGRVVVEGGRMARAGRDPGGAGCTSRRRRGTFPRPRSD